MVSIRELTHPYRGTRHGTLSLEWMKMTPFDSQPRVKGEPTEAHTAARSSCCSTPRQESESSNRPVAYSRLCNADAKRVLQSATFEQGSRFKESGSGREYSMGCALRIRFN